MKNITPKKTKKNTKKTVAVSPPVPAEDPEKSADVKDTISRQAIDLLVQIVRGELVNEDGKIMPPTIAQRLAAAQMLLKIKERPSEIEDNQNISPKMDLPDRSKNFDEWLKRTQSMQSAENMG